MAKEDIGNLASALKDQIALVSLLVLFAGFVSTDTYYAAFGLRYQTLDLPLDHLMYRGVTALFHSRLLGVTYLAVVAWLAAGAPFAAQRIHLSELSVRVVSYAIIALSVLAAYYAGINEGQTAAVQDRNVSTSQLPTVQSVRSTGLSCDSCQGWRMLSAGKDQIVLFQPVSSASAVPFTHLVRADSVHELVIVAPQ